MEDEVAQLKAYINELEENNETLTKEYHKLSDDYDDLLYDYEMLGCIFDGVMGDEY